MKNINNFDCLLYRNDNIKLEVSNKKEYLKLLKNKVIYYNLLLRNIKDSYREEMQEREKLKKQLKDLMQSKVSISKGEITNRQTKIDYLKNSIYKRIKHFRNIKVEYDRDFAKLLEEKFVINLKKYEKIIEENENEFKFVSKKLEDKDNKQIIKSIKIQEIESKAQEEFLFKNSNLPKPKEWIEQKGNFLIVELDNTSSEFEKIAKMFSDSLFFKIRKISIIQNKKLWTSFCFAKLNLNINDSNGEKLLFYGLEYNKPESIYGDNEEGFDMKLATTSSYGQALHFHENAKSAHPERNVEGDLNYLLVAIVLIGDCLKVEVGYSFMKVPPIKDKVKNTRYHSILSPDGKYMIYNNFRAYPAYLIRY